jgi:beta-mannosidase
MLVRQQQLRWIRTTLLGRIPGWSPPVAPVGPFRPVTIVTKGRVSVASADLRASFDGGTGVLRADVRAKTAGTVRAAAIVIEDPRGGITRAELAHETHEGVIALRGEIRVASAEAWFPHTHGAQPLYRASIELTLDGAESPIRVLTRTIGFRTIELVTDDGGFGLRVNGVPVFCRGACWTPLDVITLGGTREDYRRALEQVRDAGMNMIRVGGTMAYETDDFYALCDELGIMIWQDFMFANMDYPASDAGFVDGEHGVRAEARQFLSRTQTRASLAVLCGNSEIEQQTAMLGLSRELWRSPLFGEVLPSVCAELRPDVPDTPSTPTGGALPFQPSEGTTHYYGVGAYLRPLEDARRAGVRFTPECLGFANVPAQSVIDALLGSGESPMHHPKWKARVPRDSGPGWDFDDVRDHYLAQLFDVDPMRLRYADVERYLALSRVVTGELMARTFEEWRRARSTCRGGLVWFLRDLWPGAGWGVVDAKGGAKAALHALRRALKPRAVFLSDEGLGGLGVHVVNESADALEGVVRIVLVRGGDVEVAKGERAVSVPARGAIELAGNAFFESFLDLAYAYRFGPPGHDLVVATLHTKDEPQAQVGETAFFFPLGLAPLAHARERDLGLEATATRAEGSDDFLVTLRTKRFAQSIALEVDGMIPADDHFHLAPGATRVVRLRPADGKPGGERKLRGIAQALNAVAPIKIGSSPS